MSMHGQALLGRTHAHNIEHVAPLCAQVGDGSRRVRHLHPPPGTESRAISASLCSSLSEFRDAKHMATLCAQVGDGPPTGGSGGGGGGAPTSGHSGGLTFVPNFGAGSSSVRKSASSSSLLSAVLLKSSGNRPSGGVVTVAGPNIVRECISTDSTLLIRCVGDGGGLCVCVCVCVCV